MGESMTAWPEADAESKEKFTVDFKKIHDEVEQILSDEKNKHLKYKDGSINPGIMRDLLTNAFVKEIKEKGSSPTKDEIAIELDHYIIEYNPFALTQSEKREENKAFIEDKLAIDNRNIPRSSIAQSTIDQIFGDLNQ
jgi:hypothetical protein